MLLTASFLFLATIKEQFPWFDDLYRWWKNNPAYNLVYGNVDPMKDFGDKAAALFKIGPYQFWMSSAPPGVAGLSSSVSSLIPTSFSIHSTASFSASSLHPSLSGPSCLSPLLAQDPSFPSSSSASLPPCLPGATLSVSPDPFSYLQVLLFLSDGLSPLLYPCLSSLPSALLPPSSKSGPPLSLGVPPSSGPHLFLLSSSLGPNLFLPVMPKLQPDKKKKQDNSAGTFNFDSIFLFDDDSDDNDDLFGVQNLKSTLSTVHHERVVSLNDDPLPAPLPRQPVVSQPSSAASLHHPASHMFLQSPTSMVTTEKSSDSDAMTSYLIANLNLQIAVK